MSEYNTVAAGIASEMNSAGNRYDPLAPKLDSTLAADAGVLEKSLGFVADTALTTVSDTIGSIINTATLGLADGRQLAEDMRNSGLDLLGVSQQVRDDTEGAADIAAGIIGVVGSVKATSALFTAGSKVRTAAQIDNLVAQPTMAGRAAKAVFGDGKAASRTAEFQKKLADMEIPEDAKYGFGLGRNYRFEAQEVGTLGDLAKTYRNDKLVDFAREAVVSEAIMAATMNTNGMLYPEDQSFLTSFGTNMLFAGGIGLIADAAAGQVVRRSLNSLADKQGAFMRKQADSVHTKPLGNNNAGLDITAALRASADSAVGNASRADNVASQTVIDAANRANVTTSPIDANSIQALAEASPETTARILGLAPVDFDGAGRLGQNTRQVIQEIDNINTKATNIIETFEKDKKAGKLPTPQQFSDNEVASDFYNRTNQTRAIIMTPNGGMFAPEAYVPTPIDRNISTLSDGVVFDPMAKNYTKEGIATDVTQSMLSDDDAYLIWQDYATNPDKATDYIRNWEAAAAGDTEALQEVSFRVADYINNNLPEELVKATRLSNEAGDPEVGNIAVQKFMQNVQRRFGIANTKESPDGISGYVWNAVNRAVIGDSVVEPLTEGLLKNQTFGKNKSVFAVINNAADAPMPTGVQANVYDHLGTDTVENAKKIVSEYESGNLAIPINQADAQQIFTIVKGGIAEAEDLAKIDIASLINGSTILNPLAQQRYAVSTNPVMRALFSKVSYHKTQMNHLSRDLIGNSDLKVLARRIKKAAPQTQLNFHEFSNSRRFGWDIEEIRNSDGSLLLKDTQRNKNLWMQGFNQPLPKGAVMPTYSSYISPTQAAVPWKPEDELVDVFINEIGRVSDMVWFADSLSKGARGKYAPARRAYHIPALNIRAGTRLYIPNADDRGFRVVLGATAADARKQAEALVEDHSLIKTEDQLNRYFNVNNIEELEDIIDFSNSGSQTGQSTGALARGELLNLDPSQFDDIVDALGRQVSNIAKRTSYEMNYATTERLALMHQAFIESQGGSLTKNIKDWHTEGTSIYKQARDIMLENPSRSGYDATDKLMNFIELGAQGMLEKAVSGPRRVINEKKARVFSDAVTKNMSDIEKKDFGQYSQWKYKHPQLREYIASMSKWLSIATLQFFDAGVALTNLAGYMPAVAAEGSWFGKMAKETAEDYMLRTGLDAKYATAASNYLGLGGVINAMQAVLDPKNKALLAYWNDRGFVGFEAVEVMNTLNATSGFNTIYATSGMEKFLKAGAWMNTKSEEFVRLVALMQGHKLGEAMGLSLEESTRMGLDHAARAIGDYAARNRPAVFQGTAGIPLGLFQTYTWNLYHRTMGYIADGDKRALATYYAMQTAVFGLKSLPGWNELNERMGAAQQGPEPISIALERALGPVSSNVILYSPLSAVTGAAFYVKGDNNLRYSAGIFPQFVNNAWSWGKEAAEVAVNDPTNLGRQMELMANYIPSRMARNGIELVRGYSTDRRGNTVETPDQVRSFGGTLTRALGLQSLRRAKANESVFHNRQAELEMTRKRAAGVKRLLAARRSGKDYADLEHDAQKLYIATGGKEANFKNWFSGIADRVDMARLERELNDNPNSLVLRQYMNDPKARSQKEEPEEERLFFRK